MNTKLMHEPVLNANGKPEGYRLSKFGPNGGPEEDDLGRRFLTCANCRTVYQADGDNHGVCPARLHEALKEHVL